VGLIKKALLKYCGTLDQGAEVEEYLGEVLMGLRFCVARAHRYSPYRVVFGTEPLLPSSLKTRQFELEEAL
jgi:hypothetical protein